jgi:uncharacterized protein (DUF608 family)
MDANDTMRCFEGDALTQIAMPMGGLGAGCICLNGYGGLQDFSIANRPALSAMPDGHGVTASAFALLHVCGPHATTRLVEGPLPAAVVYNQGLKGQGYRLGGHEGLPRFEQCRFTAEYPFGHVDLCDSELPVAVRVTGFSPFVPLDDVASGLPCAILVYALTNTSQGAVDVRFSYNLSHLAPATAGDAGLRSAAIPGSGVRFWNTDEPLSERAGSAAFGVVGHVPRIKGEWLRGGWFDSITALWREIDEDRFVPNAGSPDAGRKGRCGGSVEVGARLEAGATLTIPVVIAWHFPNVYASHGCAAPAGQPVAGCGCAAPSAPAWRPRYVAHWADAGAVLAYVTTHYASLAGRTRAFRDALAASTVPAPVLDAVASNLAILKSPTVLRQENGNVWGWEGCFADRGCCHGSCTHVWNYAQALPHLFPALERTLREQELLRSMDARGHVSFRAALPDGPTDHGWHAAADGQLGGILKFYRDWQICGDPDWLRGLYPSARRSLEFCIATWDPDRCGALVEPHHNTYDIEFWGPDGMCTTIYCGALRALALMAGALGEEADRQAYDALAVRSARYLDGQLFNGEYYVQKPMWQELRALPVYQEKLANAERESPEVAGVLRREGPIYQYGAGCLADGVIGAWMAALYGVPADVDRAHVRQHLAAVFRNNWKADLFRHACLQRPGYAVGHEPGLLLCTWPRGGRPTLPFVYCDEVWTGFEYQVASHLILEGLVEEGLAVVRGARQRHDGRTRNPFNEYECGNYYARAMSSYALLPALAGFRYSAVERTLWLEPRLAVRPFRAFFSTATGWGTVALEGKTVTVTLSEGRLRVERLVVCGKVVGVDWDLDAGARARAVCTYT